MILGITSFYVERGVSTVRLLKSHMSGWPRCYWSSTLGPCQLGVSQKALGSRHCPTRPVGWHAVISIARELVVTGFMNPVASAHIA